MHLVSKEWLLDLGGQRHESGAIVFENSARRVFVYLGMEAKIDAENFFIGIDRSTTQSQFLRLMATFDFKLESPETVFPKVDLVAFIRLKNVPVRDVKLISYTETAEEARTRVDISQVPPEQVETNITARTWDLPNDWMQSTLLRAIVDGSDNLYANVYPEVAGDPEEFPLVDAEVSFKLSGLRLREAWDENFVTVSLRGLSAEEVRERLRDRTLQVRTLSVISAYSEAEDVDDEVSIEAPDVR